MLNYRYRLDVEFSVQSKDAYPVAGGTEKGDGQVGQGMKQTASLPTPPAAPTFPTLPTPTISLAFSIPLTVHMDVSCTLSSLEHRTKLPSQLVGYAHMV